MKTHWGLWYLIGLFFFILQQAGAAMGWLPPLDFILPLIFWQAYWCPLNRSLVIFTLVWGGVVDTFSTLLPGPAVLSYLVAIVLLYYFKGRFTPWVPLTRMLSFGVTFLVAECLRLYVLPVVLDLPLPRDMLRIGLEVVGGAVFWSLILELLSQTAVARDLFANK